MKTLIYSFAILSMWMTVIILFSWYTVEGAEMAPNHQNVGKYTYQQGLALSLNIATCLIDDTGVSKFLAGSLNRFEYETGSRDLSIMFLVYKISQNYGIDLDEKLFEKTGVNHFVKTVDRCGKLYE